MSNPKKVSMAKNFALIGLFAVVFFLSLSMIALAADDVEWVEKQSSAKLYWGDSVIVDNYVIKAEDFSGDSVFISISKDGEKLKAFPLSEGMEVVYNDKIKVCAKKVDPNYETVAKNGKEFKTKTKNPFAELNISIRGEPSLDLEIETNKDAYDSKSAGDSEMHVSINIKNEGDAEAKDVVLTVDTAGMQLVNGKTKYTYSRVLKDETLKPINLTLKTPAPERDTDFNISAKTTCSDIKGTKYEFNDSKTIKVEKEWGLAVSKSFSENYHMGDIIHVSVSVRNKGHTDINNIVLNDSIASGMHLQENTTLKKTLSLKAGEKAENVIQYKLIPESPGEFTLPVATATFTLSDGQNEEITSNNSGAVKVSGPNISVTKTVDKQQLSVGDILNVTVKVQNTGNVNANVKVDDTLPPETKLVSGETNFKQVLKSGSDSKTITYSLQMNREGEIQLPACKASFYDLDEYSGEISSDSPIVHVGTQNSLTGNNTQTEAANKSNPMGNNSSYLAQNGSINDSKNGSTNESSNESSNENSSESTPGFNFFSSIIGFLAITEFLRRKIA
jgi:uncharacterized repeat protein (TIGR01451 family)